MMDPRSRASLAASRVRLQLHARGLLLAWSSVALCACAGGGGEAASPVAAKAPAPTLAAAVPAAKPKAPKPKVIVCVWDGLRPDSISDLVTPNLARLRDHEGVNFSDHHSVYPTFTMMNAAALATGAYPEQHGFYGNTEYQPGPVGQNADGKAIDFSQPVFTEDHGVLQALDGFYRARGARGLFAVETLFESAHTAANAYLMRVFLDYILPKFDPDLSIVWLRNPDSTEHQFGPGTPNYQDALRDQDALLGKLQARLEELGLGESTDLIVVSDHGHSTVGGDPAIFPLRGLKGEADGHGEVGAIDSQGYVVSGEIRSADVLTRAGFKHVYDGGGCLLDPVLTGIRKDGSLVYPTRVDRTGICSSVPAVTPTGKKQAPTPAQQYSLPAFRVPAPAPSDAIVIAANGGSEYYYVLDHSPKTVAALARAFQERNAYGAVFVRSLYGAIPGTLPLSAIYAEGRQDSPPTPDLIVSFTWDDSAVTGGNAAVPGTEYASAQRYRGMHGSFSPRDVHNVLVAQGPHFKVGFEDRSPSGNVDIAPTVAALLALPFHAPDGRVLTEAFAGANSDDRVEVSAVNSTPVTLGRTCRPDDPGCERPLSGVNYSVTLVKKTLHVAATKQNYSYCDRATVTRGVAVSPPSGVKLHPAV